MLIFKANMNFTLTQTLWSLLSILIVLGMNSCTGLNYRNSPFPISPNTHPVESYSKGNVFLKGGFFYHFNSSVTFSGAARLERKGRACSHSGFYLIALGSSRIYDAKFEGGVNKIGMIEAEVLAILGGAYHRHCTIVVGE